MQEIWKLEKNTEFRITERDYLSWKNAYPGVNIEGELVKMQVWLDANPLRAKKNVKRFIVNWLSRAHSRLLERELEVTLREDIRRSRVPL